MYVISNTFPGFGSMTVRNTNMVTMPSFVVMTQCIFHEKRSEKNRNTIIYVIMKKRQVVNISFLFNIFKDFSSGSVWELYLLSVMILIALFCNLMSLCVAPQ